MMKMKGRSVAPVLIIFFLSLMISCYSLQSETKRRRSITLVSWDGEAFQVDEAVTRESKLVEGFIKSSHGQDLSPISVHIMGNALSKVIEFMELQQGYCDEEKRNNGSDEWEKNFFSQLDNCTLILMAYGSAEIQVDRIYNLAVAELSRPQEERGATACGKSKTFSFTRL